MQPRKLAITNGQLWRGATFESRRVLLLDGGRIEAIVDAAEPLSADHARVDAQGLYVAPGFMDVLTHGSFGHAPEGDVLAMARAMPSAGVTWFLPSLISAPLPSMFAAAHRIAQHVGAPAQSARIGGIHVEGGFFNPRYGGQKPENTMLPTPENVEGMLEACGGHLRQLTLAPELPGGIEAVARLRRAGVVVSIGHSEADAATYRAARDAGLSHATHIMNALGPSGLGQPYQGVRLAGLEEWLLTDDGLTADMISDRTGLHVSAEWQKIVLRCKGLDRLLLASDAMPCAGLPPGEYTVPDGQIVRTSADNDVALLPGSLLFGSTLTLDRALRSVVQATGISLADALRLVTINPARLHGLDATYGTLDPGKQADIVLFDDDVTVHRAFVGGLEVYTRGTAAST